MRDWCEQIGVASVTAVTTIQVAGYIERLGRRHPAPTVKRYLAAIRHLFDYRATGGLLPFNPAAAVRGPEHVFTRGKTPMDERDCRAKLAIGLCDPQLLGLGRDLSRQAITLL